MHVSNIVNVHHINSTRLLENAQNVSPHFGCLKKVGQLWESKKGFGLTLHWKSKTKQRKYVYIYIYIVFWILDDLCQGFLTLLGYLPEKSWEICWSLASPGFQALILEERHIEALPSECFGSNKMCKGWVFLDPKAR